MDGDQKVTMEASGVDPEAVLQMDDGEVVVAYEEHE